MIRAAPDVVVGTFNSSPEYQQVGYNYMVVNGFSPRFSQPTYCPAATHATFAPCTPQPVGVLQPQSIPVDNIFVNDNGPAPARLRLRGDLRHHPTDVRPHRGVGHLRH